MYAVNTNAWNKLDPSIQTAADGRVRQAGGRYLGGRGQADDRGPHLRHRRRLHLRQEGRDDPSAAAEGDAAERSRLVSEVVLPRFGERCGADCLTDWNASVGTVIGIKAGQ
ncbi:hypothetical protein [Rhizobium sp. 9140]|uniref:hypothetical protein n=1 Tax=Rhizobium sp. 9140 TaxID=1761900 RepID=UPI0011125815|nr:hypothetical protein [Rhizobium sp. 9140]